MRKNNKDRINECLRHARCKSIEDKYDICFWIYTNCLIKDRQSNYLFRWFLKNADRIESDNKKIYPHISIDVEETIKNYGRKVNSHLDMLIKANKKEEEFYDDLWRFIQNESALDTTEKKVFAVLYTWIDIRIPYYQLETGLSMGNEEFSRITMDIRQDIEKARFIMCTNSFEQRTMRASVLLNLIDIYSNRKKERIVLMAHILSFIRLSIPRSELLRALRHIESVEAEIKKEESSITD